MSDGSQKLLDLKEGDVFELGSLLSGLDQGKEKIVWTCLETVPDPDSEAGTQRITLHAHYFETYLMPAIVRVNTQGHQHWSIG